MAKNKKGRASQSRGTDSPTPNVSSVWWKNKYWYIPITLVLIAGYVVGGWLWLDVNFLNKYVKYIVGCDKQTLLILNVFFGGIVGGTIVSTNFFVNDANKKLYNNPQNRGLPNFIDPIIYSLHIFGGGVTAIILYAAVIAGFIVVGKSDQETFELTREGAWIISIGGGLGTHPVKLFLMRLMRKILQVGEDLDEEMEGKKEAKEKKRKMRESRIRPKKRKVRKQKR